MPCGGAQMNNPKHFPDLDLVELINLANEWVEEYPVITQLLLCRGKLDRDKHTESFKYALVAITSQESDSAELARYRNWAVESCSHVIEGLVGVYSTPPKDDDYTYLEEWIWFDEESENWSSNEFITPKSALTLYPPTEISQEKEEKLIAKQEDYKFIKEGPTWSITYEGRTIRVPDRKGLKEIQYLLHHCSVSEEKDVRVDVLAVEVDKFHPSTVPYDESPQYDSRSNADSRDYDSLRKKDKKRKKGTLDADIMIYDKSVKEIKKERAFLNRELEKAIEDKDPGRIEAAQRELDDFNKHIASYFNIKGRSRKFPTDFTRTKDRIRRRISRAIEAIKKEDEQIYQHFQKAIKFSHNSAFVSYKPDRKIDWIITPH
jgi:hypothetical protein